MFHQGIDINPGFLSFGMMNDFLKEQKIYFPKGK